MENTEQELEYHPWQPFIPENAKVLIMGTFPPQRKRWSMDFYYPNRTNDFWFMMGLIFLGDRNALYIPDKKCFDLEAIKRLLCDKGIALNDTGRIVRRLKGNASDKFLEIVEPVPLFDLLEEMPGCHTVATTGEKAAGVIAQLTGTPLPKMGEMVSMEADTVDHSELSGEARRTLPLDIWRMPSTSRAFPMKLEKKAEYYAEMFRHAGILQ